MMQTDEQLIDRIRTELRAELSGLEPPADLLERLGDAKPADGRERGPFAHRRRSSMPIRGATAGWIAAVTSVLGMIVVAAVFLLADVHRPRSSEGAVPSGARSLVAILGVLRRPQTSADRTAPAALRGRLVEASLTRLVHVGPDGLRAYLAVTRGGNGGPGDQLAIEFVEPRAPMISGWRGLTAADILNGTRSVGVSGYTPSGRAHHRTQERIEMVAPDGVSRVRIRFAPQRLPTGATAAGATVDATVESNFVLTTAAIPCCEQPAQITWLAAAGQPVKTISPTRPDVIPVAPPAHLRPAARAQFTAGREVFASAGCLACHQLAGNGNNGPGGDLTRIGAKMTNAQLARALTSPRVPMPPFRSLPKREFANLLKFLSELK
jgi:mono/diheme cytochrome c family protein